MLRSLFLVACFSLLVSCLGFLSVLSKQNRTRNKQQATSNKQQETSNEKQPETQATEIACVTSESNFRRVLTLPAPTGELLPAGAARNDCCSPANKHPAGAAGCLHEGGQGSVPPTPAAIGHRAAAGQGATRARNGRTGHPGATRSSRGPGQPRSGCRERRPRRGRAASAAAGRSGRAPAPGRGPCRRAAPA